ncbi:hypothetical protein DES49_0295 [Halospina denitrificans]|uniref:Uncharacterized protein n=1 Tax=Halospina denitrificans TaxID=332522 RepID=A0A4R7K0V7_9GAMM|nr:hypothetical protein [Halospina denitrificans]TDT44195.1 hypothetical protein DES49_0295 [Halospina denitrificans]
MPVSEETKERVQGYSIVRITETNNDGDVTMETFALAHESGGQLDEFADYLDAVKALNRLLFPLPGLPEVPLHRTG